MSSASAARKAVSPLPQQQEQFEVLNAPNITQFTPGSSSSPFASSEGRRNLDPSEDLLEVDFRQGVISAVGIQFGVGRVAKPTPTPTPTPTSTPTSTIPMASARRPM